MPAGRPYPQAHIALVGLPGEQWFVERFHNYVDDLTEFPGYPGIPERSPQIRELPRFLNTMQERAFDLVLQMQGNGLVMNEFAIDRYRPCRRGRGEDG